MYTFYPGTQKGGSFPTPFTHHDPQHLQITPLGLCFHAGAPSLCPAATLLVSRCIYTRSYSLSIVLSLTLILCHLYIPLFIFFPSEELYRKLISLLVSLSTRRTPFLLSRIFIYSCLYCLWHCYCCWHVYPRALLPYDSTNLKLHPSEPSQLLVCFSSFLWCFSFHSYIVLNVRTKHLSFCGPSIFLSLSNISRSDFIGTHYYLTSIWMDILCFSLLFQIISPVTVSLSLFPLLFLCYRYVLISLTSSSSHYYILHQYYHP